jgi:hypothetical protein
MVAFGCWERTLPAETRLVPAAVRARNFALLAPALSLLVIAVPIRRHWDVIRTIPRATRALLLALLLLLQISLAGAATTAGVFTQRDWLFGNVKPFLVRTSPERTRTAYLTGGCLLFSCSVALYLQDGSSLTMRRIQQVSAKYPLKSDVDWGSDASTPRIRLRGE